MTDKQEIIPIVMAGGAGSRLWPLSRTYWPKQFLRLGKSTHSLLQDTILRSKSLSHKHDPIIITSQELHFVARHQISEINLESEIIAESCGRGTAAAATIAALRVAEFNPQCVLVIQPADHWIGDVALFNSDIRKAAKIAETGKILTLAIKPDRIESGYGYIKTGTQEGDALNVIEFVEKPDLKTAGQYFISGGYFWNAGYYIVTAETLLKEMQIHDPQVYESATLAWQNKSLAGGVTLLSGETWESVKDEALDRSVAEKSDNLLTVIHKGKWNDLGNYETLWEEEEKDTDGNVKHGQVVTTLSHGNYIRAPRRSVATIGIKNTIIVADDDFILIADRDSTHHIPSVLQEVKERGWEDPDYPTRIHRPWGWYERMVSRPTYQAKRICLLLGQAISLQSHEHRSEHWVITKGTAELTLGQETKNLQRDDVVFIPVGVKHRLRNIGKEPVEWIEVQTGSYFGEDDIKRYSDDYGRET